MYNDRPIGNDQYEQWRQSVHGRALLEKGDLSAPACNDCHGNHGAMPPGVDSVANACGTCHGKISNLFAETRMKHAFEQSGLPGCAACHGSHLIRQPQDEMLGMESGAVCFGCHNPENPQYGATLAGADTARTMRSRLDQLKRDIESAEAIVQEAERLGMEVRGPRFELRQAFDALTNARTQVHSFKPEPVETAIAEGLKVTTDVTRLAEGAHLPTTVAGLLARSTLVGGWLTGALHSNPADCGEQCVSDCHAIAHEFGSVAFNETKSVRSHSGDRPEESCNRSANVVARKILSTNSMASSSRRWSGQSPPE
jgi:predicted CXXCH cytochrome family protein